MPQQMIGIGAAPNDGTGSKPRPAGQVINENFSENYADIAAHAQRLANVETFSPGGAAAGRALQAKLGDALHVHDFGADPSGAADSTAAFAAAFATGRSVVASGQYKITGAIPFSANGQWLLGHGCRLLPTGAFDLFTVAGGLEACGIVGTRIEATGMTAGHIISCTWSNRFTMRDVHCWTPRNFAKLVRSNWFTLDNVWVNNIRGAYGIWWYGDNATGRSDVLRIVGGNFSGNSSRLPTAIIMDGAVQTLQIQGLVAVNVDQGIWVRNSGAATLLPAFIFADDIEVDFPARDAIRLEVGSHYHFGGTIYLHGSSAGSGINVAAGVSGDTVSVGPGKVTGHARYGIESATRLRLTNTFLSGNTLGSFSNPDVAVFRAPRVEIDPNAYYRMNADGPVLNFDADDYIGFNRATNTAAMTIAAAQVWNSTADRFAFNTPVRLAPFAFAGLPAAATASGWTVRVTDRNHRLATSDGTAWRWADGTVAS